MIDPEEFPSEFDRVVRLFPLPNVVFFPHAVLPLHIFEPRYRQMTEEALASDRLITMVMIRPGADLAIEDPPIEPVACVGKIFDYRRLPDGRFNFLLVGLRRVQLLRESPKDRLYRRAEVEVLEDVYPDHPEPDLRAELKAAFDRGVAAGLLRGEDLGPAFEASMPLGAVTDLLGHYLGLPSPLKQALLVETRVEVRARHLIKILDQLTPGHRPRPERSEFPPPFSAN